MLHTALFSLVAVVLVRALADQVPLGYSGHLSQDERHPVIDYLDDEGITAGWSLNELPNPNATDHLVFETVYSLLQHWPNTRMRNGHNIVPGTIPKGTLLYRGGTVNELPKGPDRVAMDPEHSFLFCHDVVDRTKHGCWHLKLMTTRPLKVVYFDGSSAANLYGPLDTQDLLIWGRAGDGNMFVDEAKRIQALCKWGKNFGLDGFVRMQASFEVVLCDFTSGVEATFDHLASKWFGSFIVSGAEMFEVRHADSWHNRFPGETRVQLDLSRMVSFYDTQLAPSLVLVRAGQERWDHRAINISAEDLSAVRSRLEANLLRAGDTSSRTDWRTLFRAVVGRYAERLELTSYLLSSPATDADEILDLAKKAQTQLRIMLTPYILSSATPTSQSAELDWAIPIYKRCATVPTHYMEYLSTSMTDSEKLLLQAIRGTSQEICRVVTRMWVAGVRVAGIDRSLNSMEPLDIAEVTQLRETWADDMKRLMAWLDWSIWVKCDPGCGPEEMCYLPTWPVGFPWLAPPGIPSPPLPPPEDFMSYAEMSSFALQTANMERLVDETSKAMKFEPGEWTRPQPRCIRRVRPYTF